MKCGNCRKPDQDSYTRIDRGHSLFEVFERLNPSRLFNEKNSYFCGQCVYLANQLKENQHSVLSDQNAFSLSHISSLTATTASISSENDSSDNARNQNQTFPSTSRSTSKRQTTPPNAHLEKENQPKPKRIKIGPKSRLHVPEVEDTEISSSRSQSLQGDLVLLNVTHESFSTESSTQPTEEQVLLDVRHDPDSEEVVLSRKTLPMSHNRRRIEYLSDSSSIDLIPYPSTASAETSKTSESQQGSVHASNAQQSQSVATKGLTGKQPAAVPLEKNPHVRQTNVNVSRTNRNSPDKQQTLAGPSAPLAKNPRIRRTNEDVRNYFQQDEGSFNVNNYSRSLAG